MRSRFAISLLCGVAAMYSSSCIRPQKYRANQSVFTYNFKNTASNYFCEATAYEAYIEFDSRGYLYGRDQLQAAVDKIQKLRKKPNGDEQEVAVLVFVHGWKNNASEESGNVWAFRRTLDHAACKFHRESPGMPVIGVYIGWPGASTRVGKFFSYWNREPVADAVGAGDLPEALSTVLAAVKGPDFTGRSTAILVGHSFGGLVMERAAIRLLRKQLAASGPGVVPSPADLIIILNEAGAAALARPFLLDLIDQGVSYTDGRGRAHPLIVSMTSEGDAATKLGYPGGESLSFNRPATENFPKLDAFGQSSSLSYNLLTAANMVALQSHQVVPKTGTDQCDVLIPEIQGKTWCMNAKPPEQRLNRTPYWIMQLPQVFIPDHSSIFRDEVITLISALLADAALLSPGNVPVPKAARSMAATPPPPPPPRAEQPAAERPTLRKSK